MMSDADFTEKYPMSQTVQEMISKKEILELFMNPEEGTSNAGMTQMINTACKNNLALTKEVAFQHIRSTMRNGSAQIKDAWKQIQQFLLIKDKLQVMRLEWILGVPQLVAKLNYQRDKTLEIGLDCVRYINDQSYKYKSGLMKSQGDVMLNELFESSKRRKEFTIIGLFYLLTMMFKDKDILEYVYSMPGPTYQYPRYLDWIKYYVPNQKMKLEQGTEMMVNSADNIKILTLIESDIDLLERKCADFENKWKAMREKAPESDFEGYKSVSQIGKDPSVMDHYPPQYIVGQ